MSTSLTIQQFQKPGWINGYVMDFPGLELKRGQMLAISGKSGSGKTTFLNHLVENKRLVKADGDTPFNPFFLAQSYESLLFPYKKGWWNISVPLMVGKKNSQLDFRVEAQKLLNHFQLDEELLDRYPSGSEMSGGEKHLVLLCRAYLSKLHNVLILDEPLTAIDASRIETVSRLLSGLVCEKTIILTSHQGLPGFRAEHEIEFPGIARDIIKASILTPNASQPLTKQQICLST